MNPIAKNTLVLIAAVFVGAVANMSIIMISGSIIPPPNGADVTTTEGLKATIHLFEPKHFLMPFLAHALGTFVGAFIAAKFVTNHHLKFALLVGAIFLLGGLSMVMMLPSPMWFNILDLGVAYIPMSYLAWKLAAPKQ